MRGSSTLAMYWDAKKDALTSSTATLERAICSSMRSAQRSPGAICRSSQTSISSARAIRGKGLQEPGAPFVVLVAIADEYLLRH